MEDFAHTSTHKISKKDRVANDKKFLERKFQHRMEAARDEAQELSTNPFVTQDQVEDMERVKGMYEKKMDKVAEQLTKFN